MARSPKKPKTKTTKTTKTLQAVSGKDYSYAMGVMQSNSLRQYLEQRHGLKEAQFDHFIGALKGSYSEDELNRMRAIIAGVEIATQNKSQMIPSLNEQITGKSDTSYVDQEIFTQGLIDGLKNKSSISPDSASKVVEQQFSYREAQLKKANTAYLEQYKKQKGVKSTPSGLLYKVIEKGNGPVPTDTAQVEVHYEGRLIDGTIFDSSYQRGQTATFGVTQVIKGWTEALQLMPVGSVYELCIPQELAYGERGTRNIPGYSTLIFKIELKAIK